MKAKSHLVHNSLKEVKITKLIPNLSTRIVFDVGMSGLFHDILFYFICYNELKFMTISQPGIKSNIFYCHTGLVLMNAILCGDCIH